MARIPARILADIQFGDDSFKAGFELTDKYQAFSAELLRLALLGIAGYGFLLSQIAVKDATPTGFFGPLLSHAPLLGVGLSCLGLAAGNALALAGFVGLAPISSTLYRTTRRATMRLIIST